MAAKLLLRECVTLEETQCDGECETLWLLLWVRVMTLLAVLQMEAETDPEGVLLADEELHLDTEPERERDKVMLPVVQEV